MRLNRFLAAAGFGSRRSCEQFIRDGKVSVNGHFITDLSTQVSSEDDVRVAGKPAKAETHTYLVLHKPRGYVCTRFGRTRAEDDFRFDSRAVRTPFQCRPFGQGKRRPPAAYE